MSKGLLIIIVFVFFGLIAASNIPVDNSGEEKQQTLSTKLAQIEEYNGKLMFKQSGLVYQELVAEYPGDSSISEEYIAFCEEQGMTEELIDELLRRLALNPTDSAAAEKLLGVYYESGTTEIYSFMEEYSDILSGSELFIKAEEEKLGKIRYIGGTLGSVSEWSSGYTFVKNTDGESGVFSTGGGTLYPYTKSEIYSYSPKYGYIAAKDNDQLVYMAADGSRALVPYNTGEKKLVYLDYAGSFPTGSAYAANVKYNGVWGYMDTNMNIGYMNYTHTTPFSCGVSAAQGENGWLLINTGFEQIGGETYPDVYRDSYDCCCFGGMVYLKGSGGWQLYSISFDEDEEKAVSITKCSEFSFEDVKPFGEYGAVKQNGKWGVIKADGTWLIEPEYDDAYSFRCGLAPFMTDGKWGYISESGNVIIEPTYDDAVSFSERGVSAVKTEDKWRFIQLEKYYYLGR